MDPTMSARTLVCATLLSVAVLACRGGRPEGPQAGGGPSLRVDVHEGWRAVGTVGDRPEYYGFRVGKLARAVRLTATGRLELTNARKGTVIATLVPRTLAPLIVEFSADATRLALATSDGTILLYDADDGRLVGDLGQTQNIRDLRLSGNGSVLVGVSGEGRLRIWETRRGTLRHDLRLPARHSQGVGLSRDGQRIITEAQPQQLVDASTGKVVAVLEDTFASPEDFIFSPDGRYFVGSHRLGAAIWRASDGKLQRTLEDVPGTPSEGALASSLHWSPSGRWVLVHWGLEDIYTVHDARNGKRVAEGEFRGLDGFAFSPREDSLAVHYLRQMQWIALPGGEELAGSAFDLAGVAFRPGREDLVVLTSASVDVDNRSGRSFETIQIPPYESSAELRGLRLTEDGREFVANERLHKLGRSFRDPLILDARTFRPLSPEPTPTIAGVAFNTDGSRLVTGGRRVQLWATDNLERRAECPPVASLGVGFPPAIALLDDGRTILTADEGYLRIYGVSRQGCRLRETLVPGGSPQTSLLHSVRPDAKDAILIVKDPDSYGETLRTVRGTPGGPLNTRWFKLLAISASGREILHAETFEGLRSFSVGGVSWDNGEPERESAEVIAAVWAHDDRYVFVLDEGGRLARIDTRSGDRKLVAEIPGDGFYPQSALLVDGGYAVARQGSDAFVVATDRTDAQVRRLGPLNAIALHAGTNRLAIATATEPYCSGGDHCHLDNVVHMLDLDTLKVRSTTPVPLSEVTAIEFDASGNRLAVVGNGLHLLTAP
jgi:WD40 repeat protein